MASTDSTAAGHHLPALQRHSPNGFGLLRLVLASLVIIQHSLALSGFESDTWISSVSLVGRATYGDIAVAGFFAVSGFLLNTSVQRHTPGRFLRLRFFRLFPGFWTALVVVAFVLAPLIAVAGMGLSGYHLLGSDSAVTYVVRNAGLVIFQPTIGTVLEGNPYQRGLDGSFWTLAPEFLCYIGLLILAIVGARFNNRSKLLTLITAASMWAVFVLAEPLLGQRGVILAVLASLGVAFFTGAVIAQRGWADQASWPQVAALAVALALVLAVGLWRPFGPILLAALVTFLGKAIRDGFAARIGTRNDISYGVYLYHFPIIQLIIALGLLAPNPWVAGVAVSILAWLLTLPVAWFSWLAVEAPAQRYSRRRR